MEVLIPSVVAAIARVPLSPIVFTMRRSSQASLSKGSFIVTFDRYTNEAVTTSIEISDIPAHKGERPPLCQAIYNHAAAEAKAKSCSAPHLPP